MIYNEKQVKILMIEWLWPESDQYSQIITYDVRFINMDFTFCHFQSHDIKLTDTGCLSEPVQNQNPAGQRDDGFIWFAECPFF